MKTPNNRVILAVLVALLFLSGCSEVKPKTVFTPEETLRKYTNSDLPSIANSFQVEEQGSKCWARFRCRESATDIYLQQNTIVGRDPWEFDVSEEAPHWLDGPKWWKEDFRTEQKYEVGTGELNGYQVTTIVDTSLIDIWVVSLLFEKSAPQKP